MEQVPRIEICEMGIDAEYIVDHMYNAGLAGWLEFFAEDKSNMGYVAV
jgi:hypothetical protein